MIPDHNRDETAALANEVAAGEPVSRACPTSGQACRVEVVDRQFKVWRRNEASSQGTDLEEKKANIFAAEILMSQNFLERDVQVSSSSEATNLWLAYRL